MCIKNTIALFHTVHLMKTLFFFCIYTFYLPCPDPKTIKPVMHHQTAKKITKKFRISINLPNMDTQNGIKSTKIHPWIPIKNTVRIR